MKRDIYMEYAKASNLGAVAVYMLMLLGGQTAQIGKFRIISIVSMHGSNKLSDMLGPTRIVQACLLVEAMCVMMLVDANAIA